jgi:outer membrane receptor protein involved in Fe transport
LLAAEQQRGWDGGVDLVFRDKVSMSVTGFSQRARDLIALMQVASSPLPTYQFQNVGEVSNKGIELEAKASPTKWLTLGAQYGYVRSRFLSVGAPNGSLRVGDVPLGIPAQTAGAVITAIPWRTTSITAGLTYVGSLEQSDFVAEYRCFGTFTEPECPSTFLTEGSTREFTMRYPAFTKVDVSIAQSLTNTLSAFLAVNNATDVRVYEGRNTSPILGRNTMLGFNIRL